MTSAIVFDDGMGELGPLTDLRASFEVRTGALTTLERLMRVLGAVAGVQIKGVTAPAGVAALTAERVSLPVNDPGGMSEGADPGVLLVNGRCVLPPSGLEKLALGEALTSGTSVVAARLAAAQARVFLGSFALPKQARTREIGEACLLQAPWDVVRFRDRAMELDLAALVQGPTQELPEGVIGIAGDQIRISGGALVYPGVVLDAGGGPIVIEDGATIRPGAVIVGPAYVGEGSTVIDRALIKAQTAIGPVCKVGGEVGGTIFQGFANKSHDGHLGDSWVGEWANFGAGTTNSNLLNTYGEVSAQAGPGAPKIRTGMRYLGCIVGDHVKFAILTRIMTGSVFGTGSMVATGSPPPTAVGRFEWLTDQRRQGFRLDKFMEVARIVMARRKVEPSAAYTARITGLHARTAAVAGSSS